MLCLATLGVRGVGFQVGGTAIGASSASATSMTCEIMRMREVFRVKNSDWAD